MNPMYFFPKTHSDQVLYAYNLTDQPMVHYGGVPSFVSNHGYSYMLIPIDYSLASTLEWL